MAEVKQSPAVMQLAKEMGVNIDSSVQFDSKTPILKVAKQLQGSDVSFGAEDAEFGGFLGKILKKATPKKVNRALASKGVNLATAKVKVDVKASAKGLVKGVGTAAAVASFAVPGIGPIAGGSALSAMKAADKLLGDPKVKNAAQLVSNTKALAALGNKPAQRGAAILGAVAQIRQAKGAQPGQAVVKAPVAVQPARYVQQVPRTTVKTLAVKTVAQKKTFWQKVKDLFS